MRPGVTRFDVKLRAPGAGDKVELGSMRRDTALQHLLLAYPDTETSIDLDHWLERRTSDPKGAFFVVADIETDKCLGFVQLTNVHGKGRHGALGIAISRAVQGRGVGRQAVTLLLDYAKETMGLRKVELEVMYENDRAIQLYRSLGFNEVGVRREHYFNGTSWHDVLLMEIFLEERQA
ncbi:GNAT family N-acetyltransferase [Parvibaculum sp.]|uniref:GNAT family N-acetyltransferase n=1 Tax=Parvibaculum sp. TaxID=2024848 RepID=UPI003919BE49